MPGPLPALLEQPLIPPPLHGLNPRTIMGKAAWDRMRRQVYARHGYTCAACGVPSRQAILKQHLEAHEHFEIDWRAQRMTLIGMEPLCHACHSFVHSGLLEVRLEARRVSRETVAVILGHGAGVLAEARGAIPPAAARLCRRLGLRHGLSVGRHPPRTPWAGWILVWNGQSYPSPYPTEAHWRRAMAASAI